MKPRNAYRYMLIQQREYFAKLCCQTTFGSAPAVSLLKLTTKGKRNSAGRVSVEATKFLKSSSFQHFPAQFASQQPEKKREAPFSCKFGVFDAGGISVDD